MSAAPQHMTSREVPAAVLSDGTLSFDGHATLGDFVGTTSTVSGEVAAGGDLASARGWIEAPVATLRTGNGYRDHDLRHVMEVETYPTMRYDLTGVTASSLPESDGGGPFSAVLHGTLCLHGVSRPVDVDVTVSLAADTARVVGAFPVDVTDYRVGGLTKMLGMLKMYERIEVHLDLRFAVAGAHEGGTAP